MVRRFVPPVRAVVTAVAVAIAFAACADSARLVSPDAPSTTRQVSRDAIETGALSSLRPLFSHTGGHEDVLFGYGPGSGSQAGCWVNQTHWQHFAEDVTFSAATSVGKIRIFGCVPPPSATPSMHIKVHADAGGAPGALLYSADVDAEWTVEGGYHVYTATLPASFVATAGITFWYGLSGNGWEPGQMSVRTPDDGRMAQFSGPTFVYFSDIGDMMFELISGGTPPPPPDADGVVDASDNCPATSNADQADQDNDGVGNVCDSDIDGDGADNDSDAFPTDPSESVDSDGDGVGNNADPYDNSNTGPALMVGTCNTGVANWSMGGGTYANDLIAAAYSSSSNHGGFVSAVSALSNSWKKAGLITGQQHGAIVSCAARTK